MSALDLLIVTGASRGIGASVAAANIPLAKKAIVIGSSSAIDDVALPQAQTEVARLRLDLTDFAEAERRVTEAIGDTKPARIGVALCAGQIGSAGGLEEGDLGEWERLFRCNVLGNLAVLKAAAANLDGASVFRAVFFAGGGAAYGYPEFSGYALSKVAVVRAVENLGMEFSAKDLNASVVALAPGAVATDMLKIVKAHGGVVRTHTDISEPTNFVRRFLTDDMPSRILNGRFVHVRDAVDDLDFSTLPPSHFTLRRQE